MRRRAGAVLLAATMAVLWSGNAPTQARGTVGGGAFGVAVVLAPTLTIAPTPIAELQPFGGSDSDGIPVGVPELIDIAGARAEISGAPSDLPNAVLAHATADVVSIRIGPSAAPTVEISGVHSECTWTNRGSGGFASIGSISVNGAPLAAAHRPAPNTVFDVAGVHIVLNEQRRSVLADGSRVIIVDAVRVVYGALEVVVAEAACDPNNFPTVAEVGTVIRNLLGQPQ